MKTYFHTHYTASTNVLQWLLTVILLKEWAKMLCMSMFYNMFVQCLFYQLHLPGDVMRLVYANLVAFLCRPAALDSSATETEDETVRLGINPPSARKNKTRKKKKERDKVLKGSRKLKKGKKDKTEKKKDKANNKQQGKLVSLTI